MKIALPSNARLSVSLPDNYEVLSIHTSLVVAHPARGTRGYQSSSLGYFESACLDLHPATLASRSAFEQFELLVAYGNDGTTTIAGLRGRFNDLITIFGGPPVDEKQVRAGFADLDMVDTPEGFLVTPSGNTATTLLTEDATVVVSDNGILHIMSGAGAERSVPSWAGTPTQHGEVWREEAEAGPLKTRPQYTFRFRQVAAVLVPGSFAADARPDFIDGLDIDLVA